MSIVIDGKIGAKCAGQLREVYCSLGSLKEIIEKMHDEFVLQGSAPSFQRVEEAYLKINGIYDDLERFVQPIFGADSVYREAGDDAPVCRM